MEGKTIQKVWDVSTEVQLEVMSAIDKHPNMNGPHEGWAVIAEELDELWDEAKQRDRNMVRLRFEAIQVAAMAIRFVIDVCDKGGE